MTQHKGSHRASEDVFEAASPDTRQELATLGLS